MDRVIVVGAGIGGLVAALDLAVAGVAVTLLERAATPGGKLRSATVAGRAIDAGPTVFTMRPLWEAIFAAAGTTLAAHLTLRPAGILARHAWSARERLDLHADAAQSAEAIGDFAGAAAARLYRDFVRQSARLHAALDRSYMQAAAPTPLSVAAGAGLRGLGALLGMSPRATLWQALGRYFPDPRLRQLFARYATYCGASPFVAPATLMLIAHVERQGVWLPEGGMRTLATALAGLVAARGGVLRSDAAVAEIVVSHGRARGVVLTDGERIDADAVVAATDAQALATGRFGAAAARAVPRLAAGARSLSAVTWAMLAQTDGFTLARHNVFFADDYAAEFAAIFGQRRLPDQPSVYVCAQDRDGGAEPAGGERLLCLVNAPATGDTAPPSDAEIARCERTMLTRLAACGLQLRPLAQTVTGPAQFAAMFPATGGALYGRHLDGWRASFDRPTACSRLPGLYLAGGSVHPGPGVPMAALSGRLAAAAVLADLASRSRSAPTPGGTSMR